MISEMTQTPNQMNFSKNFFKVEEDSEILTYYLDNKDTKKLSDICTQISIHSNRTVNAIRDRLKRYLILLSPTDIELIQSQARVKIKFIKDILNYRIILIITFTLLDKE